MLTEVKVPGFPESVTDGTIVVWHKRPGDAVKRDENLVDIETDKVTFEVPAPQDGYLKDIYEQEGATVVAGQALASISNDGGGGEVPVTASAQRPEAGDGQPPARAGAQGAATVSPSAERLLVEHGLNAAEVEGTGKGGRILKEDVLRHLDKAAGPPGSGEGREERPEAKPEAEPGTADAPRGNGEAAPAPDVDFPEQERPQRRVPMTRLRARIAERLVEAQRTAAILSTFNEINMQPVMELRRRYRDAFEQGHGVRLGVMSFFIKAAVEALKRFPVINASLDGDEIVYHGFFDIGVAVASPRGLVVPIIRDADQLGMAEIERKIVEFAEKAKEGTLSMEEISGGTFTLTNGGVFGSLLSTPILNPPQSGILGMHKIQERPVVESGQVVARPMMYVALSYDHRIIDGREAVQFLVTIKDLLEDPARMLLEV